MTMIMAEVVEAGALAQVQMLGMMRVGTKISGH